MIMNLAEGITSLIAAVVTIIAALIVLAKYMDHRFHKWADDVISNSQTVSQLMQRMATLEGMVQAMQSIMGKP